MVTERQKLIRELAELVRQKEIFVRKVTKPAKTIAKKDGILRQIPSSLIGQRVLVIPLSDNTYVNLDSMRKTLNGELKDHKKRLSGEKFIEKLLKNPREVLDEI